MAALALDHSATEAAQEAASHGLVSTPLPPPQPPPPKDSDEERGSGRRREPAREGANASTDDGPATSLDGRQLFFVFVGTAIAACLIFALGVFVGRRVEQRAAAKAAAQAASDPLAVLDQLANAEEDLTFPRVLRDHAVREGAARAGNPSARGEASDRPRDGSDRPRENGSRGNLPHYTLRSQPIPKRDTAEDLVKRLRQAGYKATLVELPRSGLSGGGRELRVQLGDFVAAEQGQALRGEIFRRYNLSTTITKL